EFALGPGSRTGFAFHARTVTRWWSWRKTPVLRCESRRDSDVSVDPLTSESSPFYAEGELWGAGRGSSPSRRWGLLSRPIPAQPDEVTRSAPVAVPRY